MWSFKSCQFDNVSLIGAQTKHFNLFTFFQKKSHSLQKLPCSPLTLTTLVKRQLYKVQTPLTVRISDDCMFGADISLGSVVLGAAAAAIMVACRNKAQPWLWLPVPNCRTLVRTDGGLSNRTNKSAGDWTANN